MQYYWGIAVTKAIIIMIIIIINLKSKQLQLFHQASPGS